MATSVPDMTNDIDEQQPPIPPATPTTHRAPIGPSAPLRGKRRKSSLKGRKMSEETKRKIRETRLRNIDAKKPHTEAQGQAPSSAPQQEDARAKWALIEAVGTELDVLIDSLSMEDCLQLIYKMRQQCERAAKRYEARRLSPEQQLRCTTCRRTLAEAQRPVWRMQTYRIDSETQTKYPVQFCSDACLVEHNRQTQGLGVISDRGILASETADKHRKTAIMQHQEKIAQDKSLAELGKQLTKQSKRMIEGEL